MKIMLPQDAFQNAIRAGKEMLSEVASREAETSYLYSIGSFTDYIAAFVAFEEWVVQPFANDEFISLDALHNAATRLSVDFGETSGPAAIATAMMNHIIENVPAVPSANEIRQLAQILGAPMDPSKPIAAMQMQ